MTSPVCDHTASHLEHLPTQISTVLDQLAVTCRGRPAERIQPLVAAAWQQAFGAELSAPALAATAVALSDGRPCCEAL